MTKNSGELELNVVISGRGKGRPVVALHGFLATSQSWHGLAQRLTTREVWAFDLKGHGASPCPADGKYTVQDNADLVLEGICRENMRDITLVGHSFGGGVALLVAAALIKQGKGRLASLVLIDSLAFPEGLSGWAKLLRLVWPLAYLPVPLFASSTTLARSAVRKGLGFICRHPENITAAAVQSYAGNLTEAARASALIQTGRKLTGRHYADIKASLAMIDVPALIVWGKQDPLVPLDPTCNVLRNALKHSTLLEVDDCGHIAHEEQPVPVLEQLVKFLA